MGTNKKVVLAVFVMAVFIAGAMFAYKLKNRRQAETPQAAQAQNSSVQNSSNSNSAASGNGGWGDDSGWGEENGASGGAPSVHISRAKQQLINVKTTAAEIEPLHKTIRATGVVTYDETMLATVNTKVEGWIEKLYVDYTGMYVKKGQPLATIYSPELYATQQEYLNVLKWAGQGKGQTGGSIGPMLSKDAASLVTAARRRLELYDIPKSEIRHIETTGKPIRDLTIYSPVSGYVVEKDAVNGMKAEPGQTLFNVAGLSRVWILADVFEDDLALIGTGQWADITLGAFPGKIFRAKIDYVYPSISGQTRTAKVRFSIPNPGLKLKPQMYSDVLINVNMGKRLVIPSSAVIDTGVRQIVYVDQGQGNFEPRAITTGVKTDTLDEVLSGLKPGEKVASQAAFLIDSESRLEGVTQ